MKIKLFKIKNYKAFYGEHTLNFGGKNVFIYGENGSGKSSLYYALKDFFQSSVENIDFSKTENIFLTNAKKGKGLLEVTFNPDKNNQNLDAVYYVKPNRKNTYTSNDTSIRDAVKIKSFLNYKSLLEIHFIKKNGKINLFDLLVNGVLKHYRSAVITGGVELGELWQNVESSISRPLQGSTYNITRKKADVNSAVQAFNSAFQKLFQRGSVENIVNFAQPILDRFEHNIEIELHFPSVIPNANYTEIERKEVNITVKYLGRQIPDPHLFLNEARLSAIAVSIYLGMVKRHVQGIPCKVLFLDDLFIGLDISNRLPLLKILDSDFSNYQIIITTYDKPWYEFVKNIFLLRNNHWKTFEFLTGRTKKGFTIPVIRDYPNTSRNIFIDTYIQTGENYFNNGDNKAAGVYLRKAFEAILKNFCFNKVPIKFVPDSSKLMSKDFWDAVKNYASSYPNVQLTTQTISNIDYLISLVLNPLSHNDVNKYEHTNEIRLAISTLRNLKAELNV